VIEKALFFYYFRIVYSPRAPAVPEDLERSRVTLRYGRLRTTAAKRFKRLRTLLR
jgi:hypothetical protein